MRIIKINDKLSVAGQPIAADFAWLAEQEFVGVINNRPDGEQAGQPGSNAEEQAAAQAGLAYVHIPVKGFAFTLSAAHKFKADLDAAEGPVLAHCKSGMRALALYAIGEVLSRRMQIDEVCKFGDRFGLDLEGAEEWLSKNSQELAV